MKLYIYEYKKNWYVTISDNNTIGKRLGSNINMAINEYFKESWDMTTDVYWANFIAKNKPVLVIDSETHPEYFI